MYNIYESKGSFGIEVQPPKIPNPQSPIRINLNLLFLESSY